MQETVFHIAALPHSGHIVPAQPAHVSSQLTLLILPLASFSSLLYLLKKLSDPLFNHIFVKNCGILHLRQASKPKR